MMWNDIEFGFHFAYNLLGPKLFQQQVIQLISQQEQECNNHHHETLSSSSLCTFYWRSTSSSSSSSPCSSVVVKTPVTEESKISSSSSSLKDIECIYIDTTIEFYMNRQQHTKQQQNNNNIQVQIQFGSFWRIVQSPSNDIHYIYSITDHAMNNNNNNNSDTKTTTTNTDTQHDMRNKASSVVSSFVSTWQQWLYNHIQYSSLQIDIQSTSISILSSMISKTIHNSSQCIQCKQRSNSSSRMNTNHITTDTNTNNNTNPDNTDDTRFNNEYYDILLHYIDFNQYIPFITVQIPTISTIISQQQQYEYRYTIPLQDSQHQQKLHGSMCNYEQAYINYILPNSIGYRTILHYRQQQKQQQQQQQQVDQDTNLANTTNQTTNTAKATTKTTTKVKSNLSNTNNTKTKNNETTTNDDESVLLSIDTLWTMFQDWMKTINEKYQNTNNTNDTKNNTNDVDEGVSAPSLDPQQQQQQQQQQDKCNTDVMNQSTNLETSTAAITTIPSTTPTPPAAAPSSKPTTTTNTNVPNKRRIIVKHKNQFNNVRMVVRKK